MFIAIGMCVATVVFLAIVLLCVSWHADNYRLPEQDDPEHCGGTGVTPEYKVTQHK